MSEVLDDEVWLTMDEAARKIDVAYNDLASEVLYHRLLESRTVGRSRLIREADLTAKAEQIRNRAVTRRRRKKGVADAHAA